VIRPARQRLALVRQRIGMVFSSIHLFPHMHGAGQLMEGCAPCAHDPPPNDPPQVRLPARAEKLARVGPGRQAAPIPRLISADRSSACQCPRARQGASIALCSTNPTSALDPSWWAEVLGRPCGRWPRRAATCCCSPQLGFA